MAGEVRPREQQYSRDSIPSTSLKVGILQQSPHPQLWGTGWQQGMYHIMLIPLSVAENGNCKRENYEFEISELNTWLNP